MSGFYRLPSQQARAGALPPFLETRDDVPAEALSRTKTGGLAVVYLTITGKQGKIGSNRGLNWEHPPTRDGISFGYQTWKEMVEWIVVMVIHDRVRPPSIYNTSTSHLNLSQWSVCEREKERARAFRSQITRNDPRSQGLQGRPDTSRADCVPMIDGLINSDINFQYCSHLNLWEYSNTICYYHIQVLSLCFFQRNQIQTQLQAISGLDVSQTARNDPRSQGLQGRPDTSRADSDSDGGPHCVPMIDGLINGVPPGLTVGFSELNEFNLGLHSFTDFS
ncbi:hypothetical protein J6590_019816 [Homalodisca vitripennis]|nr:hypothetical protein J6590_019816 [Homalodisca vitripennis]